MLIFVIEKLNKTPNIYQFMLVQSFWVCCSGHALYEDAPLDNRAWFIFVILTSNLLKSLTQRFSIAVKCRGNYSQKTDQIFFFLVTFLKRLKRKRQDFILWTFIPLFLSLLFVFTSYFHLEIVDANQLAKIFVWEYYWMLRLCGKECLTHICIRAHGEALPALCAITSHTGHSFCVKENLAKKWRATASWLSKK